jgi:hypothetical protein
LPIDNSFGKSVSLRSPAQPQRNKAAGLDPDGLLSLRRGAARSGAERCDDNDRPRLPCHNDGHACPSSLVGQRSIRQQANAVSGRRRFGVQKGTGEHFYFSKARIRIAVPGNKAQRQMFSRHTDRGRFLMPYTRPIRRFYLTPPAVPTFVISVLLAVLALLAVYGHIPQLHSIGGFTLLLIAYVVLLLGVLFRGI